MRWPVVVAAAAVAHALPTHQIAMHSRARARVPSRCRNVTVRRPRQNSLQTWTSESTYNKGWGGVASCQPPAHAHTSCELSIYIYVRILRASSSFFADDVSSSCVARPSRRAQSGSSFSLRPLARLSCAARGCLPPPLLRTRTHQALLIGEVCLCAADAPMQFFR